MTRILSIFMMFLLGLPSVAKLAEPVGKSVTEELPELKGVKIDQKIGQNLPLDLEFLDEEGKPVKLGQFLSADKPMILSPVYFGCQSLCNFHLNGLTDGLKGMEWNAGDKFQVVAVSFDSREKPPLAKAKKANYMKVYGRPDSEKGWHFLTGDAKNIAALTAAVGFQYHWNDQLSEWAHPSAAIVVSPEGVITRYLPGVFFRPQDIKLALNESVKGQLGTFVDRMVLFCFKYDEHQSKYSPVVSNIMKLGGGLMILALALWLVPFWLRVRRRLA